MSRLLWCTGLWLLAAMEPSIAPCTTLEGAGTTIDWTGGWVTVTGRGLLGNEAGSEARARRVAQLDGYRNLTEALGGVAVTVNQTLREAAADSQAVKTRLDGFVQGARVIAQRVDPGPPAELVLTMMAPLRGDQGLYQVAAGSFEHQAAEQPAERDGQWTGLILDARRPEGYDGQWPLLRPALFPTITDHEGKLLYGPSNVPDDVRAAEGNALYVDIVLPRGAKAVSVEQIPLGALATRVGERPLCLQATPVAGGDCTVYLSNEDRARFAQLDPETVLSRGKVLVLRRTVVGE